MLVSSKWCAVNGATRKRGCGRSGCIAKFALEGRKQGQGESQDPVVHKIRFMSVAEGRVASLFSGIPTVALERAFICISRPYARYFVFVTHLSVVDCIIQYHISSFC